MSPTLSIFYPLACHIAIFNHGTVNIFWSDFFKSVHLLLFGGRRVKFLKF